MSTSNAPDSIALCGTYLEEVAQSETLRLLPDVDEALGFVTHDESEIDLPAPELGPYST